MKRSAFFLLIPISFAFFHSYAAAQWSPTGLLAEVPVLRNCDMTNGKVAVARTDGIFFCPSRASEINSEIPDASHFAVVHEYGMLAIHTTSGKLADCWAAHRLATASNGLHYIKQWIRYWRAHGRPDAIYGSPEERISNIRSCCACGA